MDGGETVQISAEFDRQVANLEDLGYPRLAGMSNDEFAQLVAPLRTSLTALPARVDESADIPFVLVPDRNLVPAEKSMPLVVQDGRRGLIDMNPTEPGAFTPIEAVRLPGAAVYLVLDVDTGQETLNVTPDDALPLIAAKGRSPLTIEEGIAVLTHQPGILRARNAFSLAGSRRGDRRVPALWTSKGSPRLGWCWAGNPHTWLGSASCRSRLGP
jgi:hypothetical protein